MFKKKNKNVDIDALYENLNWIREYNQNCYKNIYNSLSSISNQTQHIYKIESLEKIIASQQCTIEQLTNVLKGKYEDGLFVIFSEDLKIPTVINNGKKITNDLTSYFSIDWTQGERPNISIEQTVR